MAFALGASPQVGFVEAEDPGLRDGREGFDHHLVLGTDRAGWVDDMDDGINALEGRACPFVEAIDKAALVGLEEAGRVDEHDLAA